MREYMVVSDSTADLPVDIVRELQVPIIPFSYSIDETVYEYYLDERDGDISDFYEKLRKGAMPVTSQVNPVRYQEIFTKYVEEGQDILYVCFSSGLSGSYQSSRIGADMVMEKYPDARIVCVDSRSAAVGEGAFLYEIMQKKKEGLDIDSLTDWIERTRSHVHHWFMVEDLFHLKRGGRISTVEAMVGSALKIKPILSVDEDGKLVIRSKARGTNKAME